MTTHKYYNPNPRKIETADCVVRAMIRATGRDWDSIYKELYEIGFEKKVMPNNKEAWEEFLKRHDFVYNKLTIKKGSKRPRVYQVAKKTKGTGPVVCVVANHIVTAVDGYYWDIWDSGDAALYGYWTRKGEVFNI